MAGVEGAWDRSAPHPSLLRGLASVRFALAPIVMAVGVMQLAPLIAHLVLVSEARGAVRAAGGLIAMARAANAVQLLLWLLASILLIITGAELIRWSAEGALSTFAAAIIVEAAGWGTFAVSRVPIAGVPGALRVLMPVVIGALAAGWVLTLVLSRLSAAPSAPKTNLDD